MLRACLSVLQSLFGNADAEITEDSPTTLAVQYRRTRTEFNRQTGEILQNSKLVGRISLVDWVQLRQRHVARDSIRWVIALQVGMHCQVEVGESHEPEGASIVAAHIGTATGKPVHFRRDSGELGDA